MNIIKNAFLNFIEALNSNGMEKEASELFCSAAVMAPQMGLEDVENKGILQPEKTPPGKIPSKPPIFKGQGGNVAPILEFSRMIDDIVTGPSFNQLPEKLKKGLTKIQKMTTAENVFKYASDKEAFFGASKDPVKSLKDILYKFDKTGPDPRKVPPEVERALDNLHKVIDTELSQRAPEKTFLDKGKDLARGVAEKGIDVAKGVSQKGKDIAHGVAEKGVDIAQGVSQRSKELGKNLSEMKQKFEDNKAEKRVQDTEKKERQDFNQYGAVLDLRNKLQDNPMYKKIFYRLPDQIRKELERIGLDIDNLKYLDMDYLKNTRYDTLRTAYNVGNVVLSYLQNKEAVTSKKAIDFSGISALITPEGKLNEREVTRALRLSIAAELDAIHLYELIADASDDASVKKVLQDIADEEKVHVGELDKLLSSFDKENEKFLEEGKKEIDELIK